jgi:hypothetical protein
MSKRYKPAETAAEFADRVFQLVLDQLEEQASKGQLKANSKLLALMEESGQRDTAIRERVEKIKAIVAKTSPGGV